MSGAIKCHLVLNLSNSVCIVRGLEEEELKVHIDKLHEYNEIKDVAQMVLGRLGEI